MKFWIFGGLLFVGAIVVLWWFGPRMIKTVWLIVRVNPYEHTVAGAPTILVLGDSTGYGTGASKAEESIAGRIGTDFPQYSLKNNSTNGRTIGELVPIAEAVTGDYALILLQIGANDILQHRDLATVESQLRAVVNKLQAHTPHLVMISSGNVGGASAFAGEEAQAYEALTRTFIEMFASVASDTSLTYVDLFIEPDIDPFILEPATYLAIDGLHPSSAGYGLWYTTLQPVVAERL